MHFHQKIQTLFLIKSILKRDVEKLLHGKKGENGWNWTEEIAKAKSAKNGLETDLKT